MKLSSPDQVKKLLLDSVSMLESNCRDYVSDTAFSRYRKISFSDTILFPMVCMNGNLSTELMDFYHVDHMPSPSAMHQRRRQISSEAYVDLFSSFTSLLPCGQRFKGLRLIGCDGTRLNLPYNPNDTDTFMNNIPGRKGINQMHMTVFHDLLNDFFIDACFDYGNSMDEYSAFNTMIDRFNGNRDKTLFIADRGFSSFNCYAHAIHNESLFLIRQRELSSLGKYIDADTLAMDDFDVTVEFNIIRRKNGTLPDNVVFIKKLRKYDYIDSNSYDMDTLRIRVVKITLENGMSELLFTNLPKGKFSTSDIRELYRLRWNVETSFRTLKYAAELIYIHSLNKDLVLQEIFGKLTLYNFSSMIRTICNAQLKCNNHDRKYKYVHNKSMSVKICARFIRGMVDNLIQQVNSFMLPVKPGRSFGRNLRRQAAESFTYR